MTWIEFSNVLYKASDDLPKPQLSLSELKAKSLEWAIQRKLPWWGAEEDVDVEAAIRCYSRSGAWPALSENETLLLTWRLDVALDAVHVLLEVETALGLSSPTQDEDTLIEWFLIRYWHPCGEDNKRGHLEGLAEAYAKGIAACARDKDA